MTTTNPILILGGNGKTGRRITAQLDERDRPYRLASRSSEPRFDWSDENTWPAAIAGVDTAYLAPPVGPTGLAQASRFVEWAAAGSDSTPPPRSGGLRRIVLLSGRGVGSPGRDFAVYESSLELEHAVQRSGADWTIVRPAWFMQGFSEDFLREYVLAGELRLSAGSGAEAWIDTDDVGDVMTEVLLDEKHTGEIYSLSGPRLLTMAEVAEELSRATGRPIEYVELAPEEHVAELVQVGLTQEDAESVRDLFAVIRNHRSEYLSDGVQLVLGREPRDFTTWAAETARTEAWPQVQH